MVNNGSEHDERPFTYINKVRCSEEFVCGQSGHVIKLSCTCLP